MHLRQIQTGPGAGAGKAGAGASAGKAGAAAAAAGLPLPATLSVEGQVQNGLNLFLPLKNPAQMPALMELLLSAQDDVQAALTSLHYVHFARFLPSPDGSVLMVITTYDGGLESYIMDFVAVLGDVFNAILQFVEGAPPLPVQRYAREFTQFVMNNDLRVIPVWSAYPDVTVIDILTDARAL
jgi:hypothetical protein